MIVHSFCLYDSILSHSCNLIVKYYFHHYYYHYFSSILFECHKISRLLRSNPSQDKLRVVYIGHCFNSLWKQLQLLELTNRSCLQLITDNVLFVCTLNRLMVFALWMLGEYNTFICSPTDLIPA